MLDIKSLSNEERIALELKAAQLDYMIAVRRVRAQFQQERIRIQSTCEHRMSHDVYKHKDNRYRKCEICGYIQFMSTNFHVVS